VSGIHLANNPLLPNNDGFDCFGCHNVHFSDCDLRTGDDDFAIVNSSDVTISNCTMESRSSGIRLEATRDSTFSNLVLHSNRGIGIYGRGIGSTENLLFSNMVIDTQLFTGHWWGKGEPIYLASAAKRGSGNSGTIRGVTFTNIRGVVEAGIILYGNPGATLRDITMNNVSFTFRTKRKKVSDAVGGNFDLRWTSNDLATALFKHDIPGLYARYVSGVSLRDVVLSWGAVQADWFSNGLEFEDFNNVEIAGFTGRQACEFTTGAAISLAHGANVTIRDSKAASGTARFLNVTEVAGELLLEGNDLSQARTAWNEGSDQLKSLSNVVPASAKADIHKSAVHTSPEK